MIRCDVYILASRPGGALYVGVTRDLIRRVYEHRTGVIPGHTKQYHVHRLVYFEVYQSARDAIQRESVGRNKRSALRRPISDTLADAARR
jgi:putative endonuclease